MYKKIIKVFLSLLVILSIVPAGFTNCFVLAETDDQAQQETTENNKRELENSAYAVLTDDGVLIFFESPESYEDEYHGIVQDKMGNEFHGTVYTNVTDKQWDLDFEEVRVAEGSRIKMNSMYRMFANCESLERFYSTGMDTSEVTNMEKVFYGCSSLTYLDISGFDTSSAQTMQGMFDSCEAIETVVLGTAFTNWLDMAFLPMGFYENDNIGVTKNYYSLYDEYPYNAEYWTGTWNRILIPDIKVEPVSVELNVGETRQLNVILSNEISINHESYWQSANENIATVDQNGLVTAVSPGIGGVFYELQFPEHYYGKASSASVIVNTGIEHEGTAYALLTDDGDLIFLRSYQEFTEDQTSKTTITDINGISYEGFVYVKVEKGGFGWCQNANDIISTFAATASSWTNIAEPHPKNTRTNVPNTSAIPFLNMVFTNSLINY